MPPFARVPIIEFRSLLLPPIRVSLRTVQSLYRPQCLPHRPSAARSPQCLAQRRTLVLYKTAVSKTVLGQHKVLPFEPYNVADPGESPHEVRLVKGKEVIADNISLKELYEKHVKPGQLLYLNDAIPKQFSQNVAKMKSENTALKFRTFSIVTTGTIPGNKKDPNAGKGQGAFRVTALNVCSTPMYVKMALDRSYQFIEHGSPVEFTIAIKRSAAKKEHKWKGNGDTESWPWIHEHFPHLRPDFIFKAMPEGSMWSVEPVSDGRLLQFVIIKASRLNRVPINYTKRLWNVKESVKKQIARGSAQQLPMLMRSELNQAGNFSYSPFSGMPMQTGPVSEQQKKLEQQETLEWMSPSSTDRYAPIEPPPKPRRNDKLAKSGYLAVPQKRRWKTGPDATVGEGSDAPGYEKVDDTHPRDEESGRTDRARQTPESNDKQPRPRSLDDAENTLDDHDPIFAAGFGPRKLKDTASLENGDQSEFSKRSRLRGPRRDSEGNYPQSGRGRGGYETRQAREYGRGHKLKGRKAPTWSNKRDPSGG